MAQKAIQRLLAEYRETRQMLAELGALLGAMPSETSSTAQRKEFMPITANKTVRELAVEVPNATRIFEKLGIDYCCGGHRSLDQACASANISLDKVVDALAQGSLAASQETSRDWTDAPLDELVDHIVAKHHAYVKAEIPRLQALLEKVVGVHGTNHPELATVQADFTSLANELAAHLMKEERILFPYVKQMSSSGGCGPSCFGTVQNPVRVMMMEHDAAGELLHAMREATADYSLPPDACFSYGTLFQALADFEADLHQHIHLENNILFPRVVAMEK